MAEPAWIDVHTHVVSPDRERFPLNPRPLSGTWYLDGPASAEQLMGEMDTAGIGHAVLVQGVGAYTFDNRYAAAAARERPERFVSACAIDVEADDALARLDECVLELGMDGIRLFALSREGPSWLATDLDRPIWDRAAELGIHVLVTILPNQLDELDRALDRCPETAVSLDHCAFALGQPATRDALLALARHPNLHLKVSTHNLDEAIEEAGHARGRIAELVDAFGANRLMWGSDYCQIHDRPYGELVKLARDAFAELEPTDRAALCSGTARSLWSRLSDSSS